MVPDPLDKESSLDRGRRPQGQDEKGICSRLFEAISISPGIEAVHNTWQ